MGIFSKKPKYNALDSMFMDSYDRLGNQKIDIFYKACLSGGYSGANLMITNDERCHTLWGQGDPFKAARLLTVWASTCMLLSFQHAKNQEKVLTDLANGFAMIFHIDSNSLRTELNAYLQAMKTDQERNNRDEACILLSNQILYLRTLRALDHKGVPEISELPIPWGVASEIMIKYPKLNLDYSVLLDIESAINVREFLVQSLDVTKTALKQ
jgi:hypothetical protein